MKLNVIERLTALAVLPKEGNFTTLGIVRELQSALSMTEPEFKEFELKQDGKQVKWNQKGNIPKEIEIGEKATDIITEALKTLDKDKKLTAQHITLYEKFVNADKS